MNNIIISSLALFFVFVTFSPGSARNYESNGLQHRLSRLDKERDNDLLDELDELRERIWILEKGTSRIDDLENRVEKQNTMMTTMKQQATYMSAFAAGYDYQRDKLETGKVLVFRRVHMKVGDGYDENTGIFTAPVDGYYAFHLYVFYEDSDDDDLGVNIVANGEAVAQAYVDDPEDNIQASVSTIVELRAGQNVKPVVSHLLGETYELNLGSLRSGFTGYLIKQA